MDLAGLIKGSSRGEGLGNRFLASARETDALLHVVRCFKDSEIVHIESDLNPERDIDIINIEMCLADLEIVEKRLEKVSKLAKAGDKKASQEESVLENIGELLKTGEIIKKRNFFAGEKEFLKELPLLTLKPVIYLANMGERDIDGSIKLVDRIARKIFSENTAVIKVAGKLENELKNLSREESEKFREEWTGEKNSPLEKLIQACFRVLGLITFYTIARDKLSAWSLKKGENVLQAAGKIHSDMRQGFIRAEVINFKEFSSRPFPLRWNASSERKGRDSYNTAREKGCLKMAGKDYIIQDGDIIYIHFARR
jgi:GTP-binding protein YchF